MLECVQPCSLQGGSAALLVAAAPDARGSLADNAEAEPKESKDERFVWGLTRLLTGR